MSTSARSASAAGSVSARDASCTSAPPSGASDVFHALRDLARIHDLDAYTAQMYTFWAAQYLQFHDADCVSTCPPSGVRAFLVDLAQNRPVNRLGRRQALEALSFLYETLLRVPLPDREGLDDLVHGDATPRVGRARGDSAVHAAGSEAVQVETEGSDGITPDGDAAVPGSERLVRRLANALGASPAAVARLRVGDVNLPAGTVTVRAMDGARTHPIPPDLQLPLRRHLRRVRAVHSDDLAAGGGSVYLPVDVGRAPETGRAWTWQFVFPARSRTVDLWTGTERRYAMALSPHCTRATGSMQAAGVRMYSTSSFRPHTITPRAA